LIPAASRAPARRPAGARSLSLALATAAASLLLSACVTTAPRVEGGLWTGRIAVRSEAGADQPARSNTGQFELSGSARHGQLVLTSPIGTVAARASWQLRDVGGTAATPDRIELDTGGGPRRYATLDDMMQDALGDALPLEAMFDWLEGRPWPGAPAQPLGPGPDGPRTGFTQLGWTVDLTQFGPARLIAADRAAPPPPLHVRVKLDPVAAPSAPAPASAPATASAS
jgi:outer membrane lipoprotein LolB